MSDDYVNRPEDLPDGEYVPAEYWITTGFRESGFDGRRRVCGWVCWPFAIRYEPGEYLLDHLPTGGLVQRVIVYTLENAMRERDWLMGVEGSPGLWEFGGTELPQHVMDAVQKAYRRETEPTP